MTQYNFSDICNLRIINFEAKSEKLICKSMNSIFKKRRAMSEVITAMLLLGITLTGGVMIYAFFQNTDFSSTAGGTAVENSVMSVKLVGYDTRDSTGLANVTSLDNKLDSIGLCTTSCSSNKDLIPSDGGTDFVVLRLRNDGIESIHIFSININDIQHTFDVLTGGVQLDVTTNAASCSASCPYPKSGQFSIIPTSSSVQKSATEVVVDQDVRLVVKLSSDINPDVELPKPLRIQIDTGRLQFSEFVISSGGAR